jgi:hypothetical protein
LIVLQAWFGPLGLEDVGLLLGKIASDLGVSFEVMFDIFLLNIVM